MCENLKKSDLNHYLTYRHWLHFTGYTCEIICLKDILCGFKRSLLLSQEKILNHSKLFHSKKKKKFRFCFPIVLVLFQYSVILSASCRCVECKTYNLHCRGFLGLIVVYFQVQDEWWLIHKYMPASLHRQQF